MLENDAESSEPYKTELPAALVGDLRRFCAATPAAPAELDSVVIGRARSSLLAVNRTRRVLRWGGGAAAAAVLVMAAALGFRGEEAVDSKAEEAAESPLDLDRNGRVDILDALVLDQRIRRADPARPGVDLNRDGLIDAADVELVARAAVSLSP